MCFFLCRCIVHAVKLQLMAGPTVEVDAKWKFLVAIILQICLRDVKTPSCFPLCLTTSISIYISVSLTKTSMQPQLVIIVHIVSICIHIWTYDSVFFLSSDRWSLRFSGKQYKWRWSKEEQCEIHFNEKECRRGNKNEALQSSFLYVTLLQC